MFSGCFFKTLINRLLVFYSNEFMDKLLQQYLDYRGAFSYGELTNSSLKKFHLFIKRFRKSSFKSC